MEREDAATREMYGLNEPVTADFGRKCLITRRLIEKGVRFIQLYSGGGHIESTWDGHNDCITNHKTHAAETDRPIAALLKDLACLSQDGCGLSSPSVPGPSTSRHRPCANTTPASGQPCMEQKSSLQ